LEVQAGAALTKSTLGEAITYCRNQWPKLIRFLEDGRLSLVSHAGLRPAPSKDENGIK